MVPLVVPAWVMMMGVVPVAGFAIGVGGGVVVGVVDGFGQAAGSIDHDVGGHGSWPCWWGSALLCWWGLAC